MLWYRRRLKGKRVIPYLFCEKLRSGFLVGSFLTLSNLDVLKHSLPGGGFCPLLISGKCNIIQAFHVFQNERVVLKINLGLSNIQTNIHIFYDCLEICGFLTVTLRWLGGKPIKRFW